MHAAPINTPPEFVRRGRLLFAFGAQGCYIL